jgi:RNA polymerase sigma-70 factor (ECF subfamily)
VGFKAAAEAAFSVVEERKNFSRLYYHKGAMDDYDEFPDEELVELVRSKDQELYRELVKRYQNKLLRYANCLLRNEEAAADVVQEALIKAFVNLQSFNTRKKFSSWLYRIVHNEAINYLKKSKKITPFGGREWLADKVVGDTDLENDFLKTQEKEAVGRALEKLPLGYKEPLVLFYFEEKSYEEVSDILRLPIGTVGTRISRGKKMLREVLSK